MPVVLVHGVPDTQRVWDAVVARLAGQDIEAYVDWLLGRLAALWWQLERPIEVAAELGGHWAEGTPTGR